MKRRAAGFSSVSIAGRAARLRDAFDQTVGCDGIGNAGPELPFERESFSPDASYHVGSRPANRMRFFTGAPTFAVEVRSENDYGVAVEDQMAAKCADYFTAGTPAVWDVDPVADGGPGEEGAIPEIVYHARRRSGAAVVP